MSIPTPQQRRSLGRPRPAHNTASTPNLASKFASSQAPPLPASQVSARGPAPNRKPSLQELPRPSLSRRTDERLTLDLTATGEEEAMNSSVYGARPLAVRTASDHVNGNQNLEVGDLVDVPGGMHGTIKFIGEVRGKKGTFAGVELSKEWAGRGKNDGDVEGTRYFTTSVKGAGIFLPSSKAYKRLSPAATDSNPATPTTPSLATFNLGGRGDTKQTYTPTATTPSVNSKFSQSVGPGRVGARSPDFKPKASRPSLPRPESPLRKTQNATSTPQNNRPSLGGPKLSKSVIGGPKYAPSPTPGRFGATVTGIRPTAGDPGKRLPSTPKPGVKNAGHGRTESRSESRSESRNGLGPEPMFDSESDNTPIGVAKTGYGTQPTQQKRRPTADQDEELRLLRKQLSERDKQLEKQAADIEEMQNSVNELQTATPRLSSATTARSSRGSGVDDLDAPSLRALVREKNEKIKQLTDDFDSHRADFRETIDILEHTSDETNRLHEQKIEGLVAENRDLHERIDRGEDMESVALQLKQLEELVQELEEGLEDARRGEAEARGEVEFLRGEVERGKAELQREKQKAATALKNAGGQMDGGSSPSDATREIKRRDDEIKGLKAIIHSLNQDETPDVGSPKSSRRVSKRSSNNQTNGHSNDAQLEEERKVREKLEREVKDLESLVDRKTYREEELEHEIQRLRKNAAHTSSSSNDVRSEHTTRPNSNQQSFGHPQPFGSQAVNSNHRPGASRNSSIDWEERGIRDAQAARQNVALGHQLESMPETSDSHSTTMTDGSTLWCDVCDTGGHDVLTCTKMFGKPNDHKRNGNTMAEPTGPRLQHRDNEEDYNLMHGMGNGSRGHGNGALSPPAHQGNNSAAVTPKATQAKMPNPLDAGNVAGKSSGVVDASRWCAMCERDGHDATDCPFETDF